MGVPVCTPQNTRKIFVHSLQVFSAYIPYILIAGCLYLFSKLWAPFTNMEWFWSQHGYVITSILKCETKLLIHSQTSTVQPLTFENGKLFHTTRYWACDYWSMLGSKLNHASKSGPRSLIVSTKGTGRAGGEVLSCLKDEIEIVTIKICFIYWQYSSSHNQCNIFARKSIMEKKVSHCFKRY